MIRQNVIPAGMSVKEAAELVGVGRPALSNLLNGRASLSPAMATRLEQTFRCSRTTLMSWQAQYESALVAERTSPEGSRTYVVSLLEPKANDVEAWADTLGARSRLAVLLRTLIHSTGRGLGRVDFPGNDDSERPGWDGLVEADQATAWIPNGISGWEFGTNKDCKRKADKDLEKSFRAVAPEDRARMTFVFVTPRRWMAKRDWAETAVELGGWKNVRVYDSSDIEQWLEQSLAGQVWFASETNTPGLGVSSLDRCWSDWANVANPPLTAALFESAIDAFGETLRRYLTEPCTRPLVLGADSSAEALAFLSVALRNEKLRTFGDRAVVIDEANVLPRIAMGAQAFVPIVWTRAVEMELAPLASGVHAIIICPRNSPTARPDIVLEPLNFGHFRDALIEAGRSKDEVSRLDRESGRSLTVLRRRLATVPAVRLPDWAKDAEKAKALVPFLLVGAWNSGNFSDREALMLLSGAENYSELEETVQALCQLDDAPLWSVGMYRGVVSKLDLLHLIAGAATKEALDRYFDLAGIVLGEDNPALDLSEEQQWAAVLYGKTREFSASFREGVSETLVLLSVFGRALFRERLGVDPEECARSVVRELLSPPLTTRVLEANDRDLPVYAEAAPNEFLKILEADLRTEEPAVLGLLRPAHAGLLSHPRRTGLLWALEGLAWNTETLPRAAMILARLAQVEIDDNWVNKPFHSLESVFTAWMPQTGASCRERISLMKKLADLYPDVAWKICVGQLTVGMGIGDYSHKPRWRTDGFGHGEPVETYGPVVEFQKEMVEMAIGWSRHSLATLSDLVERLGTFDSETQERIWELVESWARDIASDSDKATLREKLRVSVLSRRAVRKARANENTPGREERAKSVIASLEPSDLLQKHAWLFAESWVEPSADEIESVDDFDHRKREERTSQLRVDALAEVHASRGLSGLLDVACMGKAAWNVGFLLIRQVLNRHDSVELLRMALSKIDESSANALNDLIGGALMASWTSKGRDEMLLATGREFDDLKNAQLLLNAPFCPETWIRVDRLDSSAQEFYWSKRHPGHFFEIGSESTDGVERLLKAGRPRAAFFYMQYELEKVDSELIYRVLNAVGKGGLDRPGEYLLEHYYLTKAFERLNSSSVITMEQKATLEFAYLEGLSPPGEAPRIHNLERYIDEYPDLFVQAVVWSYRRKDDGLDPTELRPPAGREQAMAKKGRALLRSLRRVPGRHGTNIEERTARLSGWIQQVRKSCRGLAREDIGDYCVGELLSHAPPGEDGVWPPEPVREALEEVQSESMMEGVRIGVYNSRGVVARGEGGAQERELAEKYRRWAVATRYSSPYVSANLLMSLAKKYENEGAYHDTRSKLERRLR